MYWKDNLEGLDSLSHEDWDKNALWNQLAGRINKKKVAGKFLNGLMAVTACLFLIAGLIWISIDKGKKYTSSYNDTIYKPADTKIPAAYTEKEFHKQKGISKNETKKVNKNLVPKKEDTAPIIYPKETGTPNIEMPYEENEVNTLAIADSTVASTTPRKELRVVHINELGKPAKKSPRIARTSPGSIKDHDHKSRSDFFSKNFDDNILKIKISPHN